MVKNIVNMKYDPQFHRRRSIRLESYNYSQCGAYFINICTKNREPYFEKYLELKLIVQKQWKLIPKRYQHVELDEYIIMPDHFHGILFLQSLDWAGVGQVQDLPLHAPTIGDIVGSFKSLCVHDWLKHIYKNKINEIGKFWQRNYYEHIIRDENELNRIREYIINNPLKSHLPNTKNLY